MRERFPKIAIALLLLTGLWPEPAYAAEETWFGIAFHGSKVGYIRTRARPASFEGRPAIHLDRWSVITVRRREQVIRMEHTLDLWFTPKGVPLRYTIERKEGGETRRGEGKREGDQFVVRHTVGGRTRTRSYPVTPDLRLGSSVEWLHLQKPQPGLQVAGNVIDETEGEQQPFTLSVEKVAKKGEPGVYVVHESIGGVATMGEVDAKGLRRVELVGAGIVMTRASRTEAVRLDDALDIFSAAMFRVDARLPPRDRLDGMTVRFTADRPINIARFTTQAQVKVKGGVEIVTRAPKVPKRGAALPMKTGKVLAPFLSATDYEDLDDPRLVKTSRRVVGDARNAWSAAKRINAFVNGHLENKTLAHAFASATEALEQRAGDCTEHAVLFSALAKIAGVPTKLVTGLVYIGGPKPAFGYHEWVEVWLGSRWHPMDPTFGQDVADATHIKFSEGISDANGLQEAGLAAAALIGDVDLVVRAWKAEGKVVVAP